MPLLLSQKIDRIVCLCLSVSRNVSHRVVFWFEHFFLWLFSFRSIFRAIFIVLLERIYRFIRHVHRRKNEILLVKIIWRNEMKSSWWWFILIIVRPSLSLAVSIRHIHTGRRRHKNSTFFAAHFVCLIMRQHFSKYFCFSSSLFTANGICYFVGGRGDDALNVNLCVCNLIFIETTAIVSLTSVSFVLINFFIFSFVQIWRHTRISSPNGFLTAFFLWISIFSRKRENDIEL